MYAERISKRVGPAAAVAVLAVIAATTMSASDRRVAGVRDATDRRITPNNASSLGLRQDSIIKAVHPGCPGSDAAPATTASDLAYRPRRAQRVASGSKRGFRRIGGIGSLRE